MAHTRSNAASYHAQVTAVVSFYMIAALVMVFVNKAVLVSTPSIPLIFLAIQLVIAVFLLHLSAIFFPRTFDLPNPFDVKKLNNLLPLILVTASGLVFNTLCLRDVEASFFQIARGMVLPLTIAASSISTRTVPTRDVLIAATIVTAGFLLGVLPSVSAPSVAFQIPVNAVPRPLSLLYGLLSAFSIALHSTLLKSSLPHANSSSVQLAYFTNLYSLVILIPLILFTGEPHKLLALMEGGAKSWNWSVFITGSIITGFFGFLLCISSILSVKITSPVTHMFSSAARSVLQTILGVLVFNDIFNFHRAISILTILFGTLHYTYVKALETSEQPMPSPTSAFREKDIEDRMPLQYDLSAEYDADPEKAYKYRVEEDYFVGDVYHDKERRRLSSE